MSETDLIFVYGTLRHPNERAPLSKKLHDEGEHVGPGVFRGKLYRIGWYPGAVDSDSENDCVFGDVFRIPTASVLWDELDAFEEIGPNFAQPWEYVRVRRPIQVNGEPLHAWIYLYNRPTNEMQRIASGDFIASCFDEETDL